MNPLPFDERREKQRFWITLPFTYSTVGRCRISGRGKTLNISSSGLLIQTEETFYARNLELCIEWPVLLNESIGLHLCVRAFLIRINGNLKGLEIRSHHFKLRGRHRLTPSEVPGRAIVGAIRKTA